MRDAPRSGTHQGDDGAEESHLPSTRRRFDRLPCLNNAPRGSGCAPQYARDEFPRNGRAVTVTMEATVNMSDALQTREDALRALLQSYGSIAVAYSGGVDSTYLAATAHAVLGSEAVMVIADSPSIPRSEMAAAIEVAHARGWNLAIIETAEFEREEYLRNDENRCYICKSELFDRMERYAAEKGIAVIAYGAILDDLADMTRVGHLAAKEHRVTAPLQEAGLSKDDIRVLSKKMGLPTWNKASFACLASRVPTGAPLSAQTLSKVEQAEEKLKALGFRQYRARHHDDVCRIEIDPADFVMLLDVERREGLVRDLRAIGYKHVTLDLAGYRTGSTA